MAEVARVVLIATGIAVYAVLFLDWNHEGNPEHRPFAKVSWEIDGVTMFLMSGSFGRGSSD